MLLLAGIGGSVGLGGVATSVAFLYNKQQTQKKEAASPCDTNKTKKASQDFKLK